MFTVTIEWIQNVFCISIFPNLYIFIALSDVLPVYSEAQEFVNEQRKHQYNDMREALQVMGRVNSETPLCELHMRMNRINEGSLPFDDSKMVIVAILSFFLW